ncbi:MAG: hypothetical protein ACQEUY_06520 [Pseudomonadota bacterium]
MAATVFMRYMLRYPKVRWVLVVSIAALLLPATSMAQTLRLIDGDDVQEISVEQLRQQSNHHFHLFDPYQGEKVDMQGMPFADFLIRHFGRVPSTLRFTAWDGYEATLDGWEDPDWYLVTIENDQPLSLRSRGPVRLVERDYANRDVNNLREFNDWIWMIRSIEARG